MLIAIQGSLGQYKGSYINSIFSAHKHTIFVTLMSIERSFYDLIAWESVQEIIIFDKVMRLSTVYGCHFSDFTARSSDFKIEIAIFYLHFF